MEEERKRKGKKERERGKKGDREDKVSRAFPEYAK